MPNLEINGSFVGLSFCKRAYSLDEFVAALAMAASALSKNSAPRLQTVNDEDGADVAGAGSSQRTPRLIVEAMVHPGYVGTGWDDFNQSSDREDELHALLTPPQEILRKLACCGFPVVLSRSLGQPTEANGKAESTHTQ